MATTAFPPTIRKFNTNDSDMSRLLDFVRTDSQPIFDVFSNSKGTGQISWGPGTPTNVGPAGSLFVRNDAPTLTASITYVKHLGAPSSVWRPIPSGIGNLIYQSKDNKTITTSVPSGTWTTAQSGPINGPTVMSAYGSIQAAALCVYDNNTQIPSPITLNAGSLEAQIFINGVAVGGVITLLAASPGNSAFRYAPPGVIPYNPGDMISVSTRGIGATIASGQAAIVCTMWGG